MREAAERVLAHGLAVFYRGPSLMSVADAWSLVNVVFDADHYARTYPDLPPDERNLAHYLAHGWRDGRNASEVFNTGDYLAANPYLVELDFCPLLHYALNGAAGGRLPSQPPVAEGPAKVVALFDPAYYCRTYPEIDLQGDPLGHYLRDGWRLGLNPSAAFDTAYYLEANPDVRAAGLCPLVHFAAHGLPEGRLPTPPPDPAAIAATTALARTDSIAAWRRPLAPERVTRSDLQAAVAAVAATRGDGIIVSLSHDDYAVTTGGLQNCIGDEARAFDDAGFVHVHISPAQPLIVLAADTSLPVAVRVAGERVGVAALGDVAAALVQTRPERAPLYLVIHHLMGFAPEAVVAAAREMKPDRSVVMAHDLFTLCPQFALLRDNVAFCGGPPATSPTCRGCTYGPERPDHQRRIALLFAALVPTVVTGSEIAAGFWRSRADYPNAGVEALPLARLVLDPDYAPARAEPPLRIGFLGGPSYHKGWDVFETLASRHFGDPHYRFYHLGFVAEAQRRNIRYVPVAVTPADREAMIREVRINDLDIVVNWSRCFETFSWTAHEAVAGGALVIARRDAGNVWPSLSRPEIDRAVALDSETELFELFASGRVRALDLRRRYGSLVINPTTALLLLPRHGDRAPRHRASPAAGR